MKRLFGFLIILSWAVIGLSAQSVTLEEVWVDHNEWLNNQQGMKIHTKFSVHNGRGIPMRLRLYHYMEYDNGTPIWGNTPNYHTIDSNGNTQATCWCDFDINPDYDHTTYNDWWVFMPYSALHLYNGSYNCKIVTLSHDITHNSWNAEARHYVSFTYSNGNQNVAPQYMPNYVQQVPNTVQNTPSCLDQTPYYVSPYGVTPTPTYGNTPCGVCNTTGRCSICGGSGVSPNHAPGIHVDCGGCGGTGKCATCGGRGYY